MEKSITFVGLDVHKDTIVVALAEAGERKGVCEYGTIANTTAAQPAAAVLNGPKKSGKEFSMPAA